MRTAFQAILVILIGSCPMWCEAAESTIGAKARLLTPSRLPHPPVHNDCVCNGICDGDIHHAAPDIPFDMGALSALSFDLIAPVPSPFELRPAPDGAEVFDPEPPSHRSSPTCALLQSFRC